MLSVLYLDYLGRNPAKTTGVRVLLYTILYRRSISDIFWSGGYDILDCECSFLNLLLLILKKVLVFFSFTAPISQGWLHNHFHESVRNLNNVALREILWSKYSRSIYFELHSPFAKFATLFQKFQRYHCTLFYILSVNVVCRVLKIRGILSPRFGIWKVCFQQC